MFLVPYWKYIKIALIALLVVALGVTAYLWYQEKNKPPEVVKVPDTTVSSLSTAFPHETQSTLKDMNHQIERAKNTQAPQYHYYTYNQESADRQAQTYAKQQKADKVVKTSVTKQLPDIQNPDGTKTPGQQVVENDYYAINLNRKHDIKAGAAVVDGTAYVEVSYRNRDVELQAFYSPEKQTGGAGIKYTVAKW